MKLFVNGRKTVFDELRGKISSEDRIIWLHAASLGEYEQGVPVLERIKTGFPKHKILVTFFSPSGYEVKKNNNLAFLTTYLPLDTTSNAKKFMELVSPELALFVKYEIWPNYLQQLKHRKTTTLLISGNFRQEQPYFQWYGSFMKEALLSFEHIFVQNETSAKLLKENDFENVTVSGDTRFDRVAKQLKMNNQLDFMEEFKAGKLCVVCGSTWPEDEILLIDYINASHENVKFILTPHQIKPQQIEAFRQKLNKSNVLYSDKSGKNLSDFAVLILDTVGLLTKIYSYADIAYVGGAAGKTGLHNILEPAAFGVPIVIGQNHEKFPEAKALQTQKGLFSVKTQDDCFQVLQKLVSNENFRKETGKNSKGFILENKGATEIIMAYITAKNKSFIRT